MLTSLVTENEKKQLHSCFLNNLLWDQFCLSVDYHFSH